MNPKSHNAIVAFIWSIADDVLRDIFVRGKYRDIILPFTVLRRLDALLVPTKEKVLQAADFLIQEGIDDKSALQSQSGFPFWNVSRYTFETLLNDEANIDANLELYLDGFSPNIQEIISKFKLRNQLETMRDAGITFLLIEKFTSADINLSPNESRNSRGEPLPPLTNLGMGYVFEELIRKFNEENNEEAGEHFTPREIIKLMTHLLFLPVKDKIQQGTYLFYDPACGSGGMLTEAEHFAQQVTGRTSGFHLYGQEVNPETYAICTSDMLIKGEKPENIKYGSTLSRDGFAHLQFDFMLSNPPYGKTWKTDADAIVSERGKKGKEEIRDPRFGVGLPTISDGQLLFLMNMVHKMKHNTDLGSRIATVHNGSALFTGDAGGGESEIRKHLIENDWLECIIALPKNIFYNTGIPTYIWIVSNRKPAHRKGKVQLINALDLYVKLRKNLGDKNCELTAEHIDRITQLYTDFKETAISKIYPNEHFGYNKITVERPLRLAAKFTEEAMAPLRFDKSIAEEMAWAYEHFGNDLYEDFGKYKDVIEKHFDSAETKLPLPAKKKLLSEETWKAGLQIWKEAGALAQYFGSKTFMNHNEFTQLLSKAAKELKLKTDAKALTAILNAVSYRHEDAEPMLKKHGSAGASTPLSERRGAGGEAEPDPELRDTENVPLNQNIQEYFTREVLQHIPDAWIDGTKTVKGYEISFTRYFYNYVPPRPLEEITAEIFRLERETDGILKEITSDVSGKAAELKV